MKGLFSCFLPDESFDSAYGIPYRKLYKEGIRSLFFDIDNTLVPHDAPADEKCVRLFSELREIGFSLCILSNNKEERVRTFSERVGAEYVFKAGKPGKKGARSACKRLGFREKEVCLIGDQLLTDIFCAVRCGFRSILVRPADPSSEPPHIVCKRQIEKIIFRLSGYGRRKSRRPGEKKR